MLVCVLMFREIRSNLTFVSLYLFMYISYLFIYVYRFQMWYGYRYTRWRPSRAPSSYPPPPIPLPDPRPPPPDQQPSPLPSAPPYTPFQCSSELSTPYPFAPSSALVGTTYQTETQTTTTATMSSVVQMEDYYEEEEGWRDNGRDEWDYRTNNGASGGKYRWQVNGRERWGNGMMGERDNGRNYRGRGEWNNERCNTDGRFNGSEEWDNTSFDSIRRDKKTPYHYIPPIPADAKLTMSFPKTRQARRSTSALFSASSSTSYHTSECAEAPASGPRKPKDNISPPASSPASWNTASAADPSSVTSDDSWKTADIATPAAAPLWKTRVAASLLSVSSLWKKALGFDSGTPSAAAGSCTTSQGLDGDTPACGFWETSEEFVEGSCNRDSHTSRSSSSGDDNNPSRNELLHSMTDSPLAAPCTTPQVRSDQDDMRATLEVLVAAIHRLPSLQQPRQQQYGSIIDHITQ